MVANKLTDNEKRIYNQNNEQDYFFSPLTAQRRELRKLWNLPENRLKDWEVFLFDSELKIQKVGDALNLSNYQISITYGIVCLFKLYNELYKIEPKKMDV